MSRRSIGCYGRRRIKMCCIVFICIHIIALIRQNKEKRGEEQEAQMRAPVATLSFCFSFAWRSHDLFLLFACILIIHLMYYIFFLMELCECVCGPIFLHLPQKPLFFFFFFTTLRFSFFFFN